MPTTQTWNGSGGDGDWGNSANWSTGTLPSTLDGVVFSSGPAATLSPASGLVNIASLTMNSPAASLTVQGSLTVGAAHLNMVPNFIDTSQGTFTVDGGSLTAGQYVNSATGTVHLTNGGSYLWQGTGSTQTVDMGNSINDSFVFTQQFDGSISNFQAGQSIVYSGAVNSVTVGNNLVTFNAGNGQTYTIHLSGNYDSSNLIVSGNSILTTAVCFTTGTLIRTARGDVPVETLHVGDLAITASGEQKPIIWLGSRTLQFDRSNGQRYHQAWPIKIDAGTFGNDLPYADLWLSPGHSVGLSVIDDIFVPASLLTNGATIYQVEVDQVTYWHVELEEHDAIIANGLAAESYYDCGNREWFNGVGIADPDQKTAVMTKPYGRPIVQKGLILEAVRAQLVARAEKKGWVRSTDLDIHLLIDGKRVDAEQDGNTVQFVIPANASDVQLISNTFAPADWSIAGQGDHRQLGLYVKSLHFKGMKIDEVVSVDDPLFTSGFYHVEVAADGSCQRWTNGCLTLPKELWASNHQFFTVVRVTLMTATHPCWLKSPEPIETKQPVTLRTVA